MIESIINTPCLITRRQPSSSTDAYGNEKPAERVIQTLCEVQQRQRREEPESEVSDTEWLGIFSAGTELRTGDALSVDGLGDFELVGDPWHVRDPDEQTESHVEASLRKTAGSEDAS